MQEPIHVAFCVNDSYVPYITVTMKSIVEHHRECEVFIHVLADSVSKQSQARLEKAIDGHRNASLQVYEVDDASLQGLKIGVWTISAWYRLLLPQLLAKDVKRVLYLDADTIVTANIEELFRLDMTDKAVAGVLDTQSLKADTYDRCGYSGSKQYICSGVLLINLEYWRENNLVQKMIDWATLNHERIGFPDQDAINYICQDSKIILPLRFGILNAFFTGNAFYQASYVKELRDCVDHPAIIHYAGCYPWIRYFANHLMQSEWDKYNKMLRKPVKVMYLPTKWCFIKIMLWDMLHPFTKRDKATIEDVKNKLSNMPDV